MITKSPDPKEAGRNWASPEVVERWRRTQARRDEHFGPATEMMLDLAGLQTGHRVLDVAAGTGGQTVLAARRVGPSGFVLATDISATMLNVAAEAALKAGLTNIETQVVDAHNLDGEAESFDTVICRSGLMLFSDPPKVLRQIHHVLKLGGKFAALVFSAEEKNPYQGIPFSIVRRLGGKTPSHFSLGDPQRLRDTFRDGGFVDITVRPVSLSRHFSSAAEVIQDLKEAIFIREAMANLADAERKQAWVEIEQELGRRQRLDGLDLPGEMLIAVGTK
jgi:ubiquinone/menaquinone biosynthesis C-methylase UbiE